MSALELKRKLDERDTGGVSFILLDVRNENESEICTIHGTDFLIPVKLLKSRISELTENILLDTEIVVYCKSGVRSITGVEILLETGFKKVSHLEGGILSYIRDVAPDLPEY
ncbi:MAG: rhodanese-like domain-containing protein [Leptospiraceae bacterium]|nr:rhodanese-like domain-containing protein [Leptospiraceae bacterium]MCK6381822.1 rhodanese-like domain-containing protein [Leptospiraceae bacterium]NUM40962.1 rhodanese-like domain-containing protein [Leptospiraceae bacterium]